MKLHCAVKYFALTALAALTACASPVTVGPQGTSEEIAAEIAHQQMAVYKDDVQLYHQRLRRLQTIGHRISVNNAELCGKDIRDDYGFYVWSADALPQEYRAVARHLYGTDDGVQVYITPANTPAARAGINGGDFILAVDGTPVPRGKNAIARFEALLQKQNGGAAKTFTVSRKGKERTVTLHPQSACAYPMHLDFAEKKINAYTDGKKIYVTNGMMKFAKTDSELALVLSHELGHNIMRHIDKKIQNAVIGALIGIAIDTATVNAGAGYQDLGSQFGAMGASAHSVGFEQEADYIGLYAMKRAGYDTTNAENLWRRMSAENDELAISMRTSHPSNAERYVALRKTNAEIALKAKKGEEISPTLRKTAAAPVKTSQR